MAASGGVAGEGERADGHGIVMPEPRPFVLCRMAKLLEPRAGPADQRGVSFFCDQRPDRRQPGAAIANALAMQTRVTNAVGKPAHDAGNLGQQVGKKGQYRRAHAAGTYPTARYGQLGQRGCCSGCQENAKSF
jgi:hypothetical protein